MKANTEKQEDNEESPKIVSRNTDPVYQKDFEDSSQKKEHSQNNLSVNQNFQMKKFLTRPTIRFALLFF